MKSNRNEELKSRRDFFKKAAKSALPIIGAIVMSNMPLISNASEVQMGCRFGCAGYCIDTCSGTCKGTCIDACSRMCNGCHHSCTGNSK